MVTLVERGIRRTLFAPAQKQRKPNSARRCNLTFDLRRLKWASLMFRPWSEEDHDLNRHRGLLVRRLALYGRSELRPRFVEMTMVVAAKDDSIPCEPPISLALL